MRTMYLIVALCISLALFLATPATMIGFSPGLGFESLTFVGDSGSESISMLDASVIVIAMIGVMLTAYFGQIVISKGELRADSVGRLRSQNLSVKIRDRTERLVLLMRAWFGSFEIRRSAG